MGVGRPFTVEVAQQLLLLRVHADHGQAGVRYSLFRRAMFSNWALRLGLRGPMVFFFKAFLLRYLCLRSNWETTLD